MTNENYIDLSQITTLTHNTLGEGMLVDVSNDIATVQFENGTMKRFPVELLQDPRFFDIRFSGRNNDVMIERIVIKKLFGDIDNDISIDTANHVAILSAPNGCGKTTTFKMLMFVLSPSRESFKDICSIPFEEFSCFLSNGKSLTLAKVELSDIKKKRDSMSKMAIEQAIRFFKERVNLTYSVCESGNIVESVSFIKSGKEPYRVRQLGMFDEDELEMPYPTGMGMSMVNPFIIKIKQLLAKYNCLTRIDFIEANRLQKSYLSKTAQDIMSRYEDMPLSVRRRSDVNLNLERVDYLTKANEEITGNIQKWVQEYNRRLTEAKNKLPSMYIDAPEKKEVDFASFKKRWNNYHKELKKFYDIGILDPTEAVIKSSELEAAFEKKAAFLMTYLDAFERTLEPLQKNYEKMKLFVDIFNKRNEITHKKVQFTQNGIKIFSGEKSIDIECLSSGEKNDFVMFYRLIFNTTPNGIVLIDEPEISLHIEWQEEYLDRLIDICKMNSLQAIVATHSPNIVNGHLDLFVSKR